MRDEIRDRLKENYAAIYITIVSVMLGLALDDLVTTMRSIESLSPFNWLTGAFVAHVIFNAWVGYSAAASVARLVPSVWDSLNVFTLTIAHFTLNSAVGAAPVVFFYSACFYSAIAGGVTYYNVWRTDQDEKVDLRLESFHVIIRINAAGAIAFFIAGILVQTGLLTVNAQIAIVVLGLPFATLWLFAFLRVWEANGLPVWRRPDKTT